MHITRTKTVLDDGTFLHVSAEGLRLMNNIRNATSFQFIIHHMQTAAPPRVTRSPSYCLDMLDIISDSFMGWFYTLVVV